MTVRQGAAPIDRVSAEERILKAATEEFAASGFYGARTQAIADAAGVNKAMIHYYFRSKENLYSQVIGAAFRRILMRVGMSWTAQGAHRARLEKIVDTYMDSYEQNPALLRIVLREVVDGGGRLKRAIAEMKRVQFPPDGRTPSHWVREAARELGIGPSETIHFVVNLIGMCLVSFISPLFLESMLDMDVSDTKKFLNDRRKAVKSMVLSALEALERGKKGRSRR